MVTVDDVLDYTEFSKNEDYSLAAITDKWLTSGADDDDKDDDNGDHDYDDDDDDDRRYISTEL